jgi:hypothetical protein
MLEVVGVGEITFRKYGRFFLDLISSYGKDKPEIRISKPETNSKPGYSNG